MPISAGTYYVYTVRPGDTLYSIANRYDISVPYITRMNALYPPLANPDLIYPGQVLLVLTPGMTEHSSVLYHVTSGDTLYAIANRFSANMALLLGINPNIQDPNQIAVNQDLYVPAFVYEVEQGDTLNRIARRFHIPLTEWIKANRGRPSFSPDVLYPGFRLVAPLPSSEDIVVFEPLPGTRIADGQPLYGYARAFEGVLHYQIRDDHDQIVTPEQTLHADQGAPAYGRFMGSLRLVQTPGTPGGALRVYTRSPRDGSIQDLLEVRVAF